MGKPPVLPTYPQTWHACIPQNTCKTIAKPMEMLYFSYTDHAVDVFHELVKKYKFVTWTLSVVPVWEV